VTRRIAFALIAALHFLTHAARAGDPEAPRPAPEPKKTAEDLQAAVEVKHTPRQAGRDWAVAETPNFRVFHNESRELAEKAARLAEDVRAGAMKKWFGEVGPDWDPRCDVYLYATARDYSRDRGVPAEVPGVSTITREPDSDRILRRRIDLHCDDKNMLVGVLPHEATHVVLAGRFGPHDIPRWADEGMAVLSEPRERINLHLRNLPRHRRDDELFAAGKLMRMPDYPSDGRLIGPFYAESVSLVEFLSKEKGPETFGRFLREALDGDYGSALEKYYDVKDFDELDRRWRRYAFGEGVADNGP